MESHIINFAEIEDVGERQKLAFLFELELLSKPHEALVISQRESYRKDHQTRSKRKSRSNAIQQIGESLKTDETAGQVQTGPQPSSKRRRTDSTRRPKEPCRKTVSIQPRSAKRSTKQKTLCCVVETKPQQHASTESRSDERDDKGTRDSRVKVSPPETAYPSCSSPSEDENGNVKTFAIKLAQDTSGRTATTNMETEPSNANSNIGNIAPNSRSQPPAKKPKWDPKLLDPAKIKEEREKVTNEEIEEEFLKYNPNMIRRPPGGPAEQTSARIKNTYASRLCRVKTRIAMRRLELRYYQN